jgi:hypothetical protein
MSDRHEMFLGETSIEVGVKVFALTAFITINE